MHHRKRERKKGRERERERERKRERERESDHTTYASLNMPSFTPRHLAVPVREMFTLEFVDQFQFVPQVTVKSDFLSSDFPSSP